MSARSDHPLIAVIGDIALDYTIETDPRSARDEKVTVTHSSRDLGGTGANSAAQIVKLGTRSELISVVGNDPSGEWLLRQAAEAGIGTDFIAQAPGDSTFATIVREGSERTVYVDLGVGALTLLPDADVLERADLIYVSYAPHAVSTLVRQGFGERTVVGLEHWMTDSEFLAASRDVRAIITNTAGFAAFEHASHPAVVVTQGGDGVQLWSYGELIEVVPAITVDVVDATGAGDSFAGALCHALASGKAIGDAIRLAVVAAGLSTRRAGAQAGQPTLQELEGFARR
ncbi:carbohydrate kinase family protein [Microbacterium sp. PAMC22086]|uniref:carbohydrate kinase family protein n=1 Tax=Microbacterium sp. PAMC22086 TaxID=2861281 RepID=UPI001C631B4A|nr:carbohydrate kinase family protein [Microbacterium sp. PAMC22086]QYG13155.1 carbohydrate kinase family protein [Microbacterium sp. PAMC22086]